MKSLATKTIARILAVLVVGNMIAIPVTYRTISEAVQGNHVATWAILNAALIVIVGAVYVAAGVAHIRNATAKIKAAGLQPTPERLRAHTPGTLAQIDAFFFCALPCGILYVIADLGAGAGLHALNVHEYPAGIIAAVFASMVYIAAFLELYPYALTAARGVPQRNT